MIVKKDNIKEVHNVLHLFHLPLTISYFNITWPYIYFSDSYTKSYEKFSRNVSSAYYRLIILDMDIDISLYLFWKTCAVQNFEIDFVRDFSFAHDQDNFFLSVQFIRAEGYTTAKILWSTRKQFAKKPRNHRQLYVVIKTRWSLLLESQMIHT